MFAQTLRRLIHAKEWTFEEFYEQTGIARKTARNMITGGPSRVSTLRSIAHELGVAMIDLVDPIEYEEAATATQNDMETPTGEFSSHEWIPGRPLSSVQTTSNGLQYRIFRVQHRYQSTRFGRGKRYEFAHLPDDARDKLKEWLVRHTEVCDLLFHHEQFPICYATFPETPGYAWWVVDEWVEGNTLSENIYENKQPIAVPIIANWSVQLAKALAALHDAGVIRRELNPTNILVRAADGTLMLTDFELAKLSGNLPTVSSQWLDDPYRAPEIGAGEPTAAADIYSWGRILSGLLAGVLPPQGEESAALSMKAPQPVRELIKASTSLRHSQRPSSFHEILPVLNDWVGSLGVKGSDEP